MRDQIVLVCNFSPMHKKQEAKLERNLILVSYILSLFGIQNQEFQWLEVLAHTIKDSWNESRNDDGTSKYYDLLSTQLRPEALLSKEDLLRYDTNIMRYTDEISRGRKSPIVWKYFQYLSLLFTEIYLEIYCKDKNELLGDLNTFLSKFNNLNDKTIPNPDESEFAYYTLEELSKIAYRSATGSGKTLIMHINIKQYLFYAQKYKHTHNKILLITPNEWLSKQHKQEFATSQISAEIFEKTNTWWFFDGTSIEILEISKLAEEEWDKTVAVDSFGENNVVLIDEWHRGTSWEVWKKYRDQLSRQWFAFEYSATFGQAIHGTSKKKDRENLMQEYGKAIIFDYSYKYFYHDGYGKEYRIYNLPDLWNISDEWIDSKFQFDYLIASLLVHYQQHLVYDQNTSKAQQYNLAKPLRVFVWSSVNAVRTEKGKKVSDVIAIIQFINDLIHKRLETIQIIAQLLDTWLIDAQGKDVFDGAFVYIKKQSLTPESVYKDILLKLFHATSDGAHFYVDHLKWVDWELWLRIGNNDYFGVINVWDSSTLYKLCQEHEIKWLDKDFSESLFHNINTTWSQINLLIWSKKFTEWRSSWRVSMMWLMNIGRGEWSQIIQLFGRGVRLKWYDMSLKRSSKLDTEQQPDNKIPEYIPLLETLQIFGIRADYMTAFKEYLEREWLALNDTKKKKIKIKTQSRFDESINLHVLKKQDSYSFKDAYRFILSHDAQHTVSRNIELDMYPKIDMMQSDEIKKSRQEENKNIEVITSDHLAFINRDEIAITLKKHKDEKRMFNLSLDFTILQKIILDHSWYTLYIPKEKTSPSSFGNISRIQEVVQTLLKLYITKYYNTHKWLEEGKNLEILPMTQAYSDKQFIDEYTIMVNEDQEELLQYIWDMKKAFASNKGGTSTYKTTVSFLNIPQHLYTPLIWKDAKNETVTITPTHLNDGERIFLLDLQEHIENNISNLLNKSIYVMRNQSKSGMWFFGSHWWFYPDFVLRVVDWDKQDIIFIDPKWISRMWLKDEKIQLFRKLQKKEKEFNLSWIGLNSFIISNTSYRNMSGHWSRQDFADNHVLFQEDEWYINRIISKQ